MSRNLCVFLRITSSIALSFCMLSAFAALLLPSAQAASHSYSPSMVGPKQHYLALGDSLAFGFQPNHDFSDGFVDDYFSYLQGQGVKTLANMGCPGETSTSMIIRHCASPYHKYPYGGPQLSAAVHYLHKHAGKVSPVTLDIGANDVFRDFDRGTCAIHTNKFNTDLASVDTNLTQTILPQLQAALTINGQLTGDLIMMNYYDPYQNICPNTVPYVQLLNQHLSSDVSGFGSIVDVFTAFGGASTPNPNICTYTWMCSNYNDVHPTDQGYSVIATTFEMCCRFSLL